MKQNTQPKYVWCCAFTIGALCNIGLFLLLLFLDRTEPLQSVPILTVDFIKWQEPNERPLAPEAKSNKSKYGVQTTPKVKPKSNLKPLPKVTKQARVELSEPIKKSLLPEKIEKQPEPDQTYKQQPPEALLANQTITPQSNISTTQTGLVNKTESISQPVPMFQLTSMPRFIHQGELVYPPSMRSQGKEAVVKLAVLIDASGNVRNINVIKSAGELFDQAATSAIRSSTFAAGKVEGQPVAVLLKLPVRFKLR